MNLFCIRHCSLFLCTSGCRFKTNVKHAEDKIYCSLARPRACTYRSACFTGLKSASFLPRVDSTTSISHGVLTTSDNDTVDSGLWRLMRLKRFATGIRATATVCQELLPRIRSKAVALSGPITYGRTEAIYYSICWRRLKVDVNAACHGQLYWFLAFRTWRRHTVSWNTVRWLHFSTPTKRLVEKLCIFFLYRPTRPKTDEG